MKFIHVDGDDGSMTIKDHQMNLVTGKEEGWFQNGWIYKVPDNFVVIIPLDKLGDHTYVYEYVSEHLVSELVFQGE